MPDTEVARLVNYISNYKLSEAEWQFGMRPYSRAHPPPTSVTMQILTSQSAADALEQGHEYLPDRSVSDADDPELGAAAMEDDATGGGGGAGGFGGGGSGGGNVEEWPDDEEEEAEQRRPHGAKAGVSSSAVLTAPSGAQKRLAGPLLFGSRLKKPKNTAAAKAAQFKRPPKQPPTMSAAPLSLEGSGSASVIGTAEGSANTRRVDPCAELQVVMERNAREAREEREKAEQEKADAAKAAQEEADTAAKAQADAEAKAQEDATAKAQAEEAARGRTPQLIIPLRSAPLAPETQALTGRAGDDQPVMERGGGDPVSVEAEVTSPMPAADTQTSRPEAPQVPPVGGELVVRATPVARTPVLRRVAKATSVPRPQEIEVASSSAPDAEATIAVLPEWTLGGANATLQQHLGEAQTTLRAKEEECSKVAQERDRLAKKLAD
nr:translation initiation factor IF-2-like [Aegilops tauschii subsp. strangulata]